MFHHWGLVTHGVLYVKFVTWRKLTEINKNAHKRTGNCLPACRGWNVPLADRTGAWPDAPTPTPSPHPVDSSPIQCPVCVPLREGKVKVHTCTCASS